MFSRAIYQILLLVVILFLLALHSCTLLKIESADRPLSINDINTRYLVQSYAMEALLLSESALDSIMMLSKEPDIRLEALKWKLKMTTQLRKQSFQPIPQLRKQSFQPIPRVSLTDTWAYLICVRDYIATETEAPVLGEYQSIFVNACEINVQGIERIAVNTLNKREYPRYKEFVEAYAEQHPLTAENELYYKPIRKDYLAFKQVPDSLAIQTVGTLSQVVADASNKLDYTSELAGKKLAWRTELFIKENGLDSASLEKRFGILENELMRLVNVAENSPEILSEAVEDFRYRVQPLFRGLNTRIEQAVSSLSRDRAALDRMILRERVALDTIIQREREAIVLEAKGIADSGIKSAMKEVNRMIRNVLFFVALALLIVLGLPFYFGYLTGKRSAKQKKA
jgi:hypothetical protein